MRKLSTIKGGAFDEASHIIFCVYCGWCWIGVISAEISSDELRATSSSYSSDNCGNKGSYPHFEGRMGIFE
jgi:hypothetical protein